MQVRIGGRELEMGGPYLQEMRESTDLIDQPEGLRERLNSDGYLLMRGLQSREKVLEARREFLEVVQNAGALEPGTPLDDARISSEPGSGERIPGILELAATLGRYGAVKRVSESPEVMGFFERFLGGPVTTFDYKWIRAVGTGSSTSVHYDVVYMGQGTTNLFTVWCPFGDVSLELGGLTVCAGSQNWHKVRDTYGNMDVYRDQIEGNLSTDPVELVDKYGGEWKTTSYQAGDVVIFGMFTAHASLANQTDRYRFSMDSRYQLASEPIDERWMGDNPFKDNSEILERATVSIDTARQEWGI
ncbi:MAG: phytanoyl-CoA dioxygenase family protein [Chloroflexi bacterium]|nr:phytanoyl-CoA dioxygenase family protein [Chloroflexota bacterium]